MNSIILSSVQFFLGIVLALGVFWIILEVGQHIGFDDRDIVFVLILIFASVFLALLDKM